MKREDWKHKRRIEAEYQQAITNLMQGFFKKLPRVGKVDPFDIVREFKKYCQNGKFSAYVNAAASRMVTGLAVQSATTWRQAAAKSTQGRDIYKMLMKELSGQTGRRMKEIVEKNAKLISSIPESIGQSVNRMIAEEVIKGKRSGSIENAIIDRPDIQEVREHFEQLTESRIALIARTETSKSTTALTRARSEDMDLQWYTWRTSEDGRVRTSHRHMMGVLVSWSEPPSPEHLKNIKSKLGRYHAGDSPNCRCYPEPVLDLSDVQWPAKVYAHGSITRMTRSQFEKMTGIIRQKAA